MRPTRSGSWPSGEAGRAALFALRSARRASFSFCLACLARSRSRLARVAFPGLAIVTSRAMPSLMQFDADEGHLIRHPLLASGLSREPLNHNLPATSDLCARRDPQDPHRSEAQGVSLR